MTDPERSAEELLQRRVSAHMSTGAIDGSRRLGRGESQVAQGRSRLGHEVRRGIGVQRSVGAALGIGERQVGRLAGDHEPAVMDRTMMQSAREHKIGGLMSAPMGTGYHMMNLEETRSSAARDQTTSMIASLDLSPYC